MATITNHGVVGSKRSDVPAFFTHAKNAGKYTPKGVLGSGAHATVYKAYDHDRKVNVAVKQITLRNKSNCNPLAEFMLGKHLKHASLTKTREFLETGRHAYIVFDLAEDGDMFERLDPKGPGLSESQARAWLKQLSSGLTYMHSKKVVHRDVKPENVLIHEGRALLCDFGLAAKTKSVCSGRAPGTGAYMAPEVIAAEARGEDRIVDPAVDVWAFGIVVYAVLFADLPWELACVRDADFTEFLSSGGVNSCAYPYSLLSTSMRRMLGRLLAVDPTKRCTMKEAYEYFSSKRTPWFAAEEEKKQRKQQKAPAAPVVPATPAVVHHELPAPLPMGDSCSSLDSVCTVECSSPTPW